MPRIVALNCPSCGGSLPEDSLTCSYCGVRLEISEDKTRVVLAGIPCPECTSENAPTRRYCGMCGCPLVRMCAKCGEPNAFGVQYCGGCGVDPCEALHQMCEENIRQFEETMLETQGLVRQSVELLEGIRAGYARHYRPIAIEYGFNHVESHLDEYNRLFAEVASPDEQAIVFRAGRNDDYADLILNQRQGMWRTSFVTTDRSFIFLFLERHGFLSRPQGGSATRVPFSDVKSIDVDAIRGDLVIYFDGGEARVHLRKVGKGTGMNDLFLVAGAICQFLGPFLPPDLVSQLRDSIRVSSGRRIRLS